MNLIVVVEFRTDKEHRQVSGEEAATLKTQKAYVCSQQ